jgi:hypothetical protein
MPLNFSRLFPALRMALVAVSAVLAATTALAQPTATTRFKPEQLAAGQTGQFFLELHGSSTSPHGSVPSIPGLKMQSGGYTTGFNDNNGSVSTSLTYIFQVEADKPGHYTIPAFTLTVDGQTVNVPAATLDVTDQPAATPGGIGGQPLSLSAKVASTDVYVGEKFPLDIVLSGRDDIRLLGASGPSQTGDAFEQVQPAAFREEPEHTTAQLGDHAYDIYTWHTAITALKSGPQTLSFSMPVTVMSMDDNFSPGDAFARMRAQMGFGQEQQLNEESTPLNFNVQPLPTDGRPANFTGGIGLFSIDEPTLSTTDLQAGVPVTLSLNITGEGNFDRLQAPVLDLGPLWRAYKPKETFQPSDPAGYHGVKTFEYVLMPMSEKITELPPPQFNFFNPETKSYVDLTPKPLPVTVRPAPPGQAPPPLPAVTNNALAARTPTLVGPRTEPGSWVSPAPIFTSPYFLGAQAVPAFFLAAFVITRRRRLRLETDPAYARQLRARREAQAAVEKGRRAAAAGQAAEFFAIAQRALQVAASYSTEWRNENSAEALTWEEFDAHLTARGSSAEIHSEARQIFEAGDALRFGGFTPDQASLEQAATRLDQLVRQLLHQA